MSVRSRVPLTLLTLVAAALASFAGCRSERKGVRVGADVASLRVLMTGLQASDQGKTNWVYELSACTAPLNGDLGENNWVSFKGVGLKEGLTGCQLKIRTLAPNASELWTFVGAEPVFYFAREVSPLRFDEKGALQADAPLSKVYEPKLAPGAKHYFTLKVPAEFPAADPRKPLTAQLNCVPVLDALGIYPGDNPKAGDFTFNIELAADTAFNCASLSVNADGAVGQYQGVISGSNGQFIAALDQALTLKPVTLSKKVIGGGGGGGNNNGGENNIDVNIKPEDCTQAGKVYNTATRKCEDKPPG